MNKLNLGKDIYIKGRIGWRGLNKSEYLSISEYRIINATSLMDGYVDWNNCGYISKERYEESKEIMLEEGDILISKDGTIGKIGYVKNLKFPCTVASGIFVLRNTKKDVVDSDYLYHLLKSPIFKNFIERKKAAGSTINHLYQRDLEKFEVDLPSINIQKKISNMLNLLDDKIKNNLSIYNEVISILKDVYSFYFLQFAEYEDNKLIYNECIKRNIPEDFEIYSIEQFCNIFTGKKDVNQALDNGRYKFYSCSPDFKYSNEKIYTGKAILISGNGSYTGRTIYVDDSFDLYQRTYACVPKSADKDILEYIYYCLLFQLVPKVSGGTHGSAIPYIVYNDIAKEKIIYNKEKVDKFIDIARPLHKILINSIEENINIERMKKDLLPLLINGQIKIIN